MRTVSVLVWIALVVQRLVSCESNFIVGIGKTDITGPLNGWHLMGYAKVEQFGSGLLNKLYCRAFVIRGALEESTPVILVHTDIHSIPLRLRQEVIVDLEKLFGDKISASKVVIHAQHTHSGPGGYHPATLYAMAALGFSEEHFQFLKTRLLNAIRLALKEENQFKANIYYDQQKLPRTGRNRSPEAFAQNKIEDIEDYLAEFGEMKNTKMTILRIENEEKITKGVLSFFAIHTTSITNDNALVNSDNKGFAQYVLETKYKEQGLVAAFFQTDSGDVSPNMVDGEDELIFYGEGKNFVEACEIVGYRQASLVEKFIEEGREEHNQKKLSSETRGVLRYKNYVEDGCKPMMGVSMLAGTEDGRAIRLLYEGMQHDKVKSSFMEKSMAAIAQYITPYVIWGATGRNFAEDEDSVFTFKSSLRGTSIGYHVEGRTSSCQLPKIGYVWSTNSSFLVPEMLPIQIVKIGELILPTLPFEVTSMAGHYIRRIFSEMVRTDGALVEVLALSNAYASYMATGKEYQVQHYEGASTLFGSEQLESTIRAFKDMMMELGPEVLQSSLEEEEIFRASLGDSYSFGERVASGYKKRKDKYKFVLTRFLSFWVPGHLYEDIAIQKFSSFEELKGPIQVTFGCEEPNDYNAELGIESYCVVQQEIDGKFVDLWDDSDWSTRFLYRKKFLLFDSCSCQWIPQATVQLFPIKSGKYRIKFQGVTSKNNKLTQFTGVSSTFEVQHTFEVSTEFQAAFPYSVKSYYHKIPDRILLVLSVVVYLLLRLLFTCVMYPVRMFSRNT